MVFFIFTKKSNVQSVSQNQQNTIAEFNQTRFGRD